MKGTASVNLFKAVVFSEVAPTPNLVLKTVEPAHPPVGKTKVFSVPVSIGVVADSNAMAARVAAEYLDRLGASVELSEGSVAWVQVRRPR